MGLNVVGKAHEAAAASAPFTWFIYGSSLDESAFATWAEQHGYKVPDFSLGSPARLDGYRLAFEVRSNFWGGAVGSLVADPAGTVEGVALPMPATARGLCEHKEGAISGLFVPLNVTVAPLDGSVPIAAIAYRAAEGRRLPAEQPPSPAFLETLIRGALEWGLSPSWIAALESRRTP